MAVGILLLSPFCGYQVESQSKVVASPRLKCFKRQSWDLNPDQAGCKSEIVTLLQPGSLYIWKCLTCGWAPKPMWSHIKLTNQVRGPLCVLRRNWDHGTNEKKKNGRINLLNCIPRFAWITLQAVILRSVAEGKVQRWSHHSPGRQHLTTQTVLGHHPFVHLVGELAKADLP